MLFDPRRDGREGMVTVVDCDGRIVGSMGVETWAKVRAARCLACEDGVPLVNVTADRPDLPDTWTHQYGGEPGTISPCTRPSFDKLASLAREYVRLDREITFHLRRTVGGESVRGKYLRLCTEREAVISAMGEIVDRERVNVILASLIPDGDGDPNEGLGHGYGTEGL